MVLLSLKPFRGFRPTRLPCTWHRHTSPRALHGEYGPLTACWCLRPISWASSHTPPSTSTMQSPKALATWKCQPVRHLPMQPPLPTPPGRFMAFFQYFANKLILTGPLEQKIPSHSTTFLLRLLSSKASPQSKLSASTSPSLGREREDMEVLQAVQGKPPVLHDQLC